MGNPDIIIMLVTNGKNISIFIHGSDYNTQSEAVAIALKRYEEYISQLQKIADYPEMLTSQVETIHISELFVSK